MGAFSHFITKTCWVKGPSHIRKQELLIILRSESELKIIFLQNWLLIQQYNMRFSFFQASAFLGLCFFKNLQFQLFTFIYYFKLTTNRITYCCLPLELNYSSYHTILIKTFRYNYYLHICDLCARRSLRLRKKAIIKVVTILFISILKFRLTLNRIYIWGHLVSTWITSSKDLKSYMCPEANGLDYC